MSNAAESTRTFTGTTPTSEPDEGACGDAPSDPLDMVGCVLEGRYRVEVCVGEGGYSYVYRAQHIAFEQPVALKFLKLEGTSEQKAARLQAFQQEGRLLFRACALHPSVVQLKEFGLAMGANEPVPYLVLEWLGGLPLSREIRERSASKSTRTIAQAIETFGGIAESLATLHRFGIAHRDVKPGNLVYAGIGAVDDAYSEARCAEHSSSAPAQSGVYGTVDSPIDYGARGSSGADASPIASLRLADFGIAKLTPVELESGKKMTTSTGAGRMTPMFAAPEQWWRQLGSTGPWTDVYSFALTILHWMAGPQPLPPAQIAFLAAGEARGYPTAGALGLTLPKPVEQAFAKALAWRIEDRFANAGAFWRALLAAHRALPRAIFPVRPAWIRSGLIGLIGLVVGSAAVSLAGADDKDPPEGAFHPRAIPDCASSNGLSESYMQVNSPPVGDTGQMSAPEVSPDKSTTSPVSAVASSKAAARFEPIVSKRSPSPPAARFPPESAKPDPSAPTTTTDDDILRWRVKKP